MVISSQSEKRLKKLYYEDGYTLGRDTLFSIVKQKYPSTHPSRREIAEFLKNQKLQQVYTKAKKPNSVSSFKPVRPIHSLAADLIDFSKKRSLHYGYILVVIDTFSRYMWTRPLSNKTHVVVGKAMSSILDDIEKKYDKMPTYILSDDGSEFKGDYIKLLKKKDIEKKRTIAAQPWSNGLVERANGKLKMIMAKNKDIHKGTWEDHYKDATRIYNEYVNRSTKYAPKQAIKLDKEEQRDLRANVKKIQKNENRPIVKDLLVDTKVRVKIPKGKLDKMSTPNWSEKIHKIERVIKGSGPRATKYVIEGKDADKRYSSNDLLVIDEPNIENIPKKNTGMYKYNSSSTKDKPRRNPSRK